MPPLQHARPTNDGPSKREYNIHAYVFPVTALYVTTSSLSRVAAWEPLFYRRCGLSLAEPGWGTRPIRWPSPSFTSPPSFGLFRFSSPRGERKSRSRPTCITDCVIAGGSFRVRTASPGINVSHARSLRCDHLSRPPLLHRTLTRNPLFIAIRCSLVIRLAPISAAIPHFASLIFITRKHLPTLFR